MPSINKRVVLRIRPADKEGSNLLVTNKDLRHHLGKLDARGRQYDNDHEKYLAYQAKAEGTNFKPLRKFRTWRSANKLDNLNRARVKIVDGLQRRSYSSGVMGLLGGGLPALGVMMVVGGILSLLLLGGIPGIAVGASLLIIGALLFIISLARYQAAKKANSLVDSRNMRSHADEIAESYYRDKKTPKDYVKQQGWRNQGDPSRDDVYTFSKVDKDGKPKVGKSHVYNFNRQYSSFGRSGFAYTSGNDMMKNLDVEHSGPARNVWNPRPYKGGRGSGSERSGSDSEGRGSGARRVRLDSDSQLRHRNVYDQVPGGDDRRGNPGPQNDHR